MTRRTDDKGEEKKPAVRRVGDENKTLGEISLDLFDLINSFNQSILMDIFEK